MNSLQPSMPLPGVSPDRFETTHWSVIFSAVHADDVPAKLALEKLCRKYWRPLHAFACRKGCSDADAEDLTQGFFEKLLSHQSLGRAHPDRGRFRSFLLTGFRHFMIEEWDRSRALKRGGSEAPVPLDAFIAREVAEETAAGRSCPEFDRQWAERLMLSALTRLRAEFEAAGKADVFHRLKPFLSRIGEREDYVPLAASLGLKADSLPVAVHRLRRRFAELVRIEVTQTVSRANDVDDELRYLIEIMSG